MRQIAQHEAKIADNPTVAPGRIGRSSWRPSATYWRSSGGGLAVIDAQDPPVALAPEQRAEARANAAQADAIVGWLDALGAVGRKRDTGALAADLSDLYVAAASYRRLLDQLLALAPHDRSAAADTVVDIATELRHLAWHIRSVTPRLDRLAAALDLDDADPDGIVRPAKPGGLPAHPTAGAWSTSPAPQVRACGPRTCHS
jgi:hypothetical protein